MAEGTNFGGDTEGTSYTDDELNIISERAAQIQKEFRSELRAAERKKTSFRKKPRSSAANRSLPIIPSRTESIQSDLNELNDFLANKMKDSVSQSTLNQPEQHTSAPAILQRATHGIDPDDTSSFMPILEVGALDEALQKSIDKIKRNMHLTDDETATQISSRAETPVNTSTYQPPRLPLTPSQTGVSKHSANDISHYLEEHDFKRKVNLLKYELEAEQKSSQAKITVLTEEVKTAKQLLEVSSQRNYELNAELASLSERLTEEIEKNHELNKTLKTRVAILVEEVETFKRYEKEFEYKLKEKEEYCDELQMNVQEKSGELEDLKEAYAKQLSDLKYEMENVQAGYEKKFRHLEEQHKVDKENIVDTFKRRQENLTKEFRKKSNEEKDIHEEEIKGLRDKIREREQDFEAQIRRQKSEFEERLTSTIAQERSTSEIDQQDALKRQQMKFEDEISMIKKRMNDEIDFERTKGLEAERTIETMKKDMEMSRDDLVALQKESVEAIKETQRTCEAACDMKMTQLKDDLNAEHMDEMSEQRRQYQGVLQDKQTADLDLERLTEKISDLESSRSKEQRKVLVRVNRACSEISSCIGIQARQVFVGHEEESEPASRGLNFDVLMKSGLDNLSATAGEVVKYVNSHMTQAQSLREQFKAYQTEKDIEVSDIRHHFESETGRMIEFTKDRLHDKYVRDMDLLRTEIRKDNDVETALRKTVDRQHTALRGMMRDRQKEKLVTDDVSESETYKKTRRNLDRLQKINTRVHTLNTNPKGE